MFKKLISSSSQAPTRAIMLSSPSGKTQSSQEKVPLGKIQGETDVDRTRNEETQDDQVPELIVPPGDIPSSVQFDTCQPKEIDHCNPRHLRDNSIETSASQSIDLASLIKKLEDNHHEQQYRNDSLSLTLSQIDVSVNDDLEDVEEYNIGETKTAPTNNNDIVDENGQEKKNGNSTPSPALSLKDNQHDPGPIAQIGEQLFRESLVREGQENRSVNGPTSPSSTMEHEVVEKNEVNENRAATIAGELSKKSSNERGNASMAKKIFYATLIVTLFIIGVRVKSSGKPEDIALNASVTVVDVSVQLLEDILVPEDVMLPKIVVSPPNMLQEEIQVECQVPKLEDRSCENILTPVTVPNQNNSVPMNGNLAGSIPFGLSPNLYGSWQVGIFLTICGLFLWLRSLPSLPKSEGKKPMESIRVSIPTEKQLYKNPPKNSPCKLRKGVFLTPPPKCREPTEWMSPCFGDGAVDVTVYESMKVIQLRELLRGRKCDYRGTKEQMIKMLVQSYQNELACLTVEKLRPKLRKRSLPQRGTKKDIIRRLVEAGPLANGGI